jgi:CheY-like chemotaxis protein
MHWSDRDSKPPENEPLSQRAPRSSSRRKVMVIDDSEIVLDATRAMLIEGGFEVVTCDSPIGAVLRVISERPDVVLVDLDMASMPGDRVITSLKSGPRTAKIPACLYTGKDAATAREAQRRCGADALIEKTWDALSLAQAVRRVMAR